MAFLLTTRGVAAVALDTAGRAWSPEASTGPCEVLVVDAADAAAADILTNLPAKTRVGVADGRGCELDGVDVWVDAADTRRLVTACLEPARAARHRPRRRETGPTGLAALTARERAVLEQLRAGLSNAAIATLLDLSPNTVRTHVQHLLAKLGVANRFEAAVVANRAAVGGDREVSR